MLHFRVNSPTHKVVQLSADLFQLLYNDMSLTSLIYNGRRGLAKADVVSATIGYEEAKT